MAAKNRPYEQFGPFILFKKLETDALGDLWRAARVDAGQLGPLVALRRLSGGDRAALTQSAAHAGELVPLLSGTTFAKEQTIGVESGVPFVAHDYSGGRSLRHVIDRARGAAGASPNPVPLDQVIAIAEKIALSLATTADLRYAGNRLAHGALIPQFIWITDEGDIRVAGQQLGAGLIASLSNTKVASEFGPYLAPEYRASGKADKTTDVYSLGAVLYLLVTGVEPPDAMSGSAFAQTIRAAKTFAGQPVPDDIRAVIEKSLAIDPAARFASASDMKQAISALSNSGRYSATTFNLAFYLSTLLKKEIEGEAIERDKESKVNVAAYADLPAAPAVATPFSAMPASAPPAPPAKNRMPLAAIAAGVIVALGAGAFIALRPRPAAHPVAKTAVARPAAAKVLPQPIVAAIPAGNTAVTATTGSSDPAAQKKAFEAAVAQKLQEEMMKLQSDLNKQLKQQQSKNAPVQMASMISTPAQQQTDDRGAAAALDQRRLASRQETPAAVAQSAPQQSAAPLLTQQQTAPQVTQTQAPVSTIHEGDVVDVTELDRLPEPLAPIRPTYPQMALQQRLQTTVILSALISENGDVIEVKILRGDTRFGFNDAAVRALRGARFSAPMKDGKRVKTWRPQTIAFRM